MTARLEPGRDERGSVLLLSLILIFVMTVLGLALFDLGVVESRLVFTGQTDARAFEIAQAGVERALQKLVDRLNAGDSWAAGTNVYCTGGTTSKHGCSESQFFPADSAFISSLSFDTGTYAIELMQVQAGTLSVPCTKNSNNLCDDLMFVRATGSLTNTPAGYSRGRTIQLLAQAFPSTGTVFPRGITGNSSIGQPINGNVKIAGSIWISGANGQTSLILGGGAGQSNSYALLDAASLQRVAALPLVCPAGRTCSGSTGLVESLGASVMISHPTDVPAVVLSGSSYLGQNGDQTYAGDATRKGKGPLDAVLVADGCTMPCTDNYTGVTLNSNLFVDDNNITKPFSSVLAAFPQLTDTAKVDGVQYTHFACPQGSSCTPPGSPSTAEFFVSRAANIASIPAIALSLGSAIGLTDATLPFEVSVTFTNQNNATVNGKICWDRAMTPLPPGISAPPAGLPRHTLEFGSPTCNTPANSANPLLLYMPSLTPAVTGFNVQRVGGPTNYGVRGSAIVVTNGLVQIEEIWESCLTAGAGTPCQNHQFNRDSLFTVMTTGDMNLGKSTSNIDRIMGLFYAGGILTAQKQTNILGSITAFRLCFAGGTSPCSPGGQVPSFFEADPNANSLVRAIVFGGGPPWTIISAPRFWVECKRAPGDTLPSGLCNYTP
jgi:hypothetical protein